MTTKLSTIVATPAFLHLDPEAAADFRDRALALLTASGSALDFIVGDPLTTGDPAFEDDGSTARVPFAGTQRVYAKLDGGDLTPAEWAANGHPEYPVLTFLLASEY